MATLAPMVHMPMKEIYRWNENILAVEAMHEMTVVVNDQAKGTGGWSHLYIYNLYRTFPQALKNITYVATATKHNPHID